MDQVIDFIKKHHTFVVAAHMNPEGDAIGSTLAMVHILRHMGRKAWPYNADPPPASVNFLPGIDELKSNVADIPEVDAAIVLDSGDADRPGEDFKKLVAQKPVLNIDHHKTNTRFGDVCWVNDSASSVGEMIVSLTRAMDLKVSADAATCLYTAILTDTGSFQFSNASPHALRAAADMVQAGARPELAAEKYYHSRPASHLKLLARCLETLDFNQDCTRGDVEVTTAMYEQAKAGPDATEGIINMITDVETVQVAILFRQIDQDKWKISLRSKHNVDVAALAEKHGGGGHKNAAGCRMEGQLDQVKKRIRDEVEKLLN